MPNRILALALLCALSSLAAPAGAQPQQGDEPRPLVFAHYMTAYRSSKAFYKREMELAQRHGIDGFVLNCGKWKGTNYVDSAEKIYQAAKELGTGFKLFISADMLGLGNKTENMVDMVERFKDHPNQLKRDGDPVLSSFGGRPGGFMGVHKKLEQKGTGVFLVPYLWQRKLSVGWSQETVQRFFRGNEHMDGVFYFGADDPTWDLIRTNANGARAAMMHDRLYMAGATPAYNSANLRDYQGMHGYAATWKGLIRDGADWVELVTWNDYNEDSGLMPFRWATGQKKQYFDRDESYLDATRYYSAWFKTGRPPKITQDKVFFMYRNRSKWLRRAWDPEKEQWIDITRGDWPRDQIHGDVHDRVYATTFLTAPAELEVTIGGESETFELDAGVSHVWVPMSGGLPSVTLRRDGQTLTSADGRKRIVTQKTQTKANSTAGYHLLNRTWTNAAVAGEAQRHEAERGELMGAAKKAGVPGGRGVRIPAEHGAGFTVGVNSDETVTYNVRITYANPSDREARLTMHANGAPGERMSNKHPAYYIPAFLPTTEQGQTRTTSFLWTLYKDTTELSVSWQKGRTWGGREKPANDDVGSATIDAIELVKVQPYEQRAPRDPKRPQMVHIPGGSFTMGTDDGDPDEAPAHKVTLSPFAISKHEITNRQYEQFRPRHHGLRDEYSWRDREPVTYVKWKDAAQYCNWLSNQHGLQPAYDAENNLRFKPGANGFRLPTEAQWAYVATGRGQGRKYPWGDEPAPTKAANAMPRSAFDPSAIDRRRSNGEAGTTVVGTVETDVTRDGVMDMGGNLMEWCTDTYRPYPDEPQTDPVAQEKSHSRVIRGGAWGSYSTDHRARDREFNNAGYGGFYTVGFRVALPQAGWKKLRRDQ